jgi:hypothetical protein
MRLAKRRRQIDTLTRDGHLTIWDVDHACFWTASAASSPSNLSTNTDASFFYNP